MRKSPLMRRSGSSSIRPTSPRRPQKSSRWLAHLSLFGKAALQNPPSVPKMQGALLAAQADGFSPAEIYQDALRLRPDWKDRLPSLSALMSEESLPAESPVPEAP